MCAVFVVVVVVVVILLFVWLLVLFIKEWIAEDKLTTLIACN